jgi:hypothetical protein
MILYGRSEAHHVKCSLRQNDENLAIVSPEIDVQ